MVTSNLSHLKTVQECAGSGECYPPTIFAYNPPESNTWQEAGNEMQKPAQLRDKFGRPRGIFLDINNDGWMDWIVSVRSGNGTTTNQTWTNGPDGWKVDTDWTLPAILYDYASDQNGVTTAQLVDVNGDGFMDVVQAYSTSTKTIKHCWLNTGAGWRENPAFELPETLLHFTSTAGPEGRAQFVDFNGDGLVDVLVATRDSNGVETRTAWRNNGAGWTVDAAYMPPTLLADYQNNPEGIMLASIADINGDGLPDWVQSVTTPSGANHNTWINTGRGWRKNPGYKLPVSLIRYSSFTGKGAPTAGLLDVNGDGLVDLVQAVHVTGESTTRATWLNTGNGWQPAPKWVLPADAIQYDAGGKTDYLGTVVDLNGDGKPEFVQSYLDKGNNTHFQAWRHGEEGWIPYTGTTLPIPLFKHYEDRSSTELALTADLNGDGLPEFFTSQPDAIQTIYTQGQIQNGVFPGSLRTITNGLGMVTRISYGVSTDAQLYTPSGLHNWPNIAANNPTMLISMVEASDGAGGWNRTTHSYAQKLVNVTGRGGLGFARHTILDKRSGLRITVERYQHFPYIGMVKKITKSHDDTILSDATSEAASLNLYNDKVVYPYIQQTENKIFELDGTPTESTVVQKQLDDYGNITNKTTTVSNANGTYRTSVSVSYTNNTDSWILGLPDISKKTRQSLNQPPHTLTVKTQYNAKGQLIREILEPGADDSLTSEFSYDGFGNRIHTSISAAGYQARTTDTTYSSDGRFPVIVTNQLGHTNHRIFDGRFGVVTSVTDPNGKIHHTTYDAFGIKIRETIYSSPVAEQADTGGGKIASIRKWCSDEGTTCPDNAVFYVSTVNNEEEAPETAYLDMFGREIRKVTLGLNNAIIYQDTEYDQFGRKHRVSRPYFKGNSPQWTTVTYDILDRPLTREAPDGSIVTFSYQGLTTTVTDANGHSSRVTKNMAGKKGQTGDYRRCPRQQNPIHVRFPGQFTQNRGSERKPDCQRLQPIRPKNLHG